MAKTKQATTATDAPVNTSPAPIATDAPQEPSAAQNGEFAGSFEIGGVRFNCIQGKGRDLLRVSELVNGDMGQMVPCTCHVLLRTEDGKQWAPEQFLDLPWADYAKLIAEMHRLGFILS